MARRLARTLRSPRAQALAASSGGLLFAALIYTYSPTVTSLYPRCLLHAVTGLYCPGCGSLRAMHALLHGRIREAVDWNVWLVVILPILAGYLLAQLYSAVRHDRYWVSRAPIPVLGVLIAAGLVFGVLRNLPIPALTWLAP